VGAVEKAHRQARLCLLVQDGPGLYTVERLAAQFGVNGRTIQRDLQELRQRGASVTRKGDCLCLAHLPEGGWEPAPPATEREVRRLALLKFICEEPGSFEPGRLSQMQARRFEVAGRTVARDLEAMAEKGLIEVRGGRCHPGRAFLPKLALTPDQALSLLSHLEVQGQLLPRGEALRRAQEKLGSCLLGEAARVAQGQGTGAGCTRLVKGRYYLQAPAVEERVTQLEEACRERRRVRFLYTALTGETGRRTADPLGLVYYWFQDAWYLVAGVGTSHDGEAEGIRHFRLDRLGEVEVTGEGFSPPDGFNLERHMAPCWGVEHGESYRVRIRFFTEGNVLARLRRETAHRDKARLTEEAGGGSVIYTDEVSGRHELRVWVRSFGRSAEVLEPEQLRREVVESVERIVQRYLQPQASPAHPPAVAPAEAGTGVAG
jgi:predicted DNA-binding transcriptional regulator YafY